LSKSKTASGPRGPSATLLIGGWQAWVDGDGHWRVRGPDPDDAAHYADGDIELTEAEGLEGGNSAARRKIRARRAKEAARAYIRTMSRPSKTAHSTRLGVERFASLHRKNVREIDRAHLDRALPEIRAATHVADYHSKIHAYGSEAEVSAFAEGLRGVKVRPITARDQQALALQKRQAFRNP